MKPAKTEFDRAALAHVAELSSLTLREDEAEHLAKDIQRILAYVDELATVDTEGVDATTIVTMLEQTASHSPRDKSALRPDVPEPSLDRAEVLSQAPRATENGFLVPTFVES